MFQRIKGAIDSRIAEEQARQRLSQASPSRSGSRPTRSSSRNISPSKKAQRQVARGRQDGEAPAKGPDPAEFEQELVIDGDEQSRSGTPRPPTQRNGIAAVEKPEQEKEPGESNQENGDLKPTDEEPRRSLELPTNVGVKLRKLEKLESRYHELLRSYRIAHARIQTIEPFETSLRENTPLTSISDPKAMVEYLNQLNLKGDMVLDELKRVSSDRDTCKSKLDAAEKSAKEAWDEVTKLRSINDKHEDVGDDEGEEEKDNGDVNDEHSAQDISDGDPLGATTKSPPNSIKSPTISVRGMSLFSPKFKQLDSPQSRKGSENLFSYDDEIPRLESDLKQRQQKIESLEHEVTNLKGDLAVTRESTSSMVQTLEEATRELNGWRDSKERSEADLKEQKRLSEEQSERLRAELHKAETQLQDLRAAQGSERNDRITSLEDQLEKARVEIEKAQADAIGNNDIRNRTADLESTISKLEAELSQMRMESKQSEKRTETLNNLVNALRSQLTDVEGRNQDLKTVMEKSLNECESLKTTVLQLKAQADASPVAKTEAQSGQVDQETATVESKSVSGEIASTQSTSSASKRKNKKKKKAGNSSTEQDSKEQPVPKDEPVSKGAPAEQAANKDALTKLQDEHRQLRILLQEKDAAIERVGQKLRDQDGLREEIETLRDDLVNVGQEHVEAKDRVKVLVAEKAALETTVAGLEKELAEMHDVHISKVNASEKTHNDLTTQFKDLKTKANALQTDLSAAQQLASTRFKDLNDLRNILQKAQPEINSLRSEAAEVKSIKETLAKKNAEFTRLDSRHEEMRNELSGLKRSYTDKDSEIRSLSQKLNQESSSRIKAEDASTRAKQELQQLEVAKRKIDEAFARSSKELDKAQQEMISSKARLRELEQTLSKNKSDSDGLKEEIDLKTAQYSSAQSLMASMRDQTAEMAVQVKEARERCESLDEEVADAHRLLGERSREGETMRRLLADVEGRADARTREMKERMDTAIEERDRAEDDASTERRRRAREMEDLRNKCRDMEKSLKRAEEDKEELEVSQRDWKRRREELEYRAGQSTKEVDEIKGAMAELRDALDGSERQTRDLEKQKADLRRSVEETQHRLDKMQKSNKSMADEIRRMQSVKSKATDSGAASSRSSQDTLSRLGSPAPKGKPAAAPLLDGANGQAPGAMDFVYLKNVLLQFLEQKDKKHQMQLIPVLGMLLHFDRKDEQKWMSAITTK